MESGLHVEDCFKEDRRRFMVVKTRILFGLYTRIADLACGCDRAFRMDIYRAAEGARVV
jgi:hypothetical protein